jgi:hypothetical protein
MPGKNNNTLVIVDAHALISFVYIDDENHLRAKHIMQQLGTANVYLLFPATAICEAITVLKGRLNRPEDAKRILTKFQSGDFPIQVVDHAILTEAGNLFNPYGSKKNRCLMLLLLRLRNGYTPMLFSVLTSGMRAFPNSHHRG